MLKLRETGNHQHLFTLLVLFLRPVCHLVDVDVFCSGFRALMFLCSCDVFVFRAVMCLCSGQVLLAGTVLLSM